MHTSPTYTLRHLLYTRKRALHIHAKEPYIYADKSPIHTQNKPIQASGAPTPSARDETWQATQAMFHMRHLREAARRVSLEITQRWRDSLCRVPHGAECACVCYLQSRNYWWRCVWREWRQCALSLVHPPHPLSPLPSPSRHPSPPSLKNATAPWISRTVPSYIICILYVPSTLWSNAHELYHLNVHCISRTASCVL